MKPIPENRRWQEERARHPNGLPPILPVEETIIIVAEPPIISARYEGTCPACRRAIQPGMSITRHAHIHRWVHLECRNAPVEQAPIPARYAGFCRVCQQPIQVGEPIIRHARRGWIHQHCAQMLAAALNIDQSLVDAIVERLTGEERLDDWEDEDVG